MTTVDLDAFLRAIFFQVNPSELVCLVDARPDPNGRIIFPPREWKPGRSRIQGQTFFCLSTLQRPERGEKIHRTLQHTRHTFVIVLDDIGTKIPLTKLAGLPSPHYILETSPGNFQWGYLIEPSDPDKAAALIHALAEAGFTDKGAQGKNRVVRVPGSINTKHGGKFVAVIHDWFPDDPRFTLDELADEFHVTPIDDIANSSTSRNNWRGEKTNDPVFNYLAEIGYVLDGANADGYASIICPWADEHTDPREDARWSVGDGMSGGFKCFHAACQDRQAQNVLDWIVDDGGPDFQQETFSHAAGIGQKLLKLLPAEAGRRGRPKAAGGRPEKRQKAPPDTAHSEDAPQVAPNVAGILAAILDDLPALRPEHLPTVERTAAGGVKATQPATAENVGYIAVNTQFAVRRNEMLGQVEITHDDPRLDVFTPIDRERLVRELLHSVSRRCGVNIRDVMDSSLDALASGNGYHPLMDWIRTAKWDGRDRIAELATTLVTDDPAWRDIAVRRWCLQAVAAWTNWTRHVPWSVPFVLVLGGLQGIGKTSWFRSLLPEGLVQTEASLRLDSPKSDDYKRKVLSSPIVELGELDTTFGGSEMGALKSFLSSTSDRYRLPYDRGVTNRVRCTVFGASVNDLEFLRDNTGARRFWPMWVTACNWQHGIDLQQLWAQAYEMLLSGGKWNLELDENKLQVVAAERHRVVSYAENLLEELKVRELAIDKVDWTFVSAAEVAKYYRLDSNTLNWRAVGRSLRELFGEPRASSGKRGWLVPIRKHEFTSGYVAFNMPPKLKVVK